MIYIPPVIANHYRPASGHEVRARSFGLLSAPRNAKAAGWEQTRGTLDDEAIFGPRQDFECACGKCRGVNWQKMICDRCGVKVTTREARRQRFGHIDLSKTIVHPLGQNAEHLYAIPVIPATFVQSPGGQGLAQIYDDLVRSNLIESLQGLVDGFDQLIELLLPAAVTAHKWELQEAELFAFGLAMVSIVNSQAETCCNCGYPVEGLDVFICPECGTKLMKSL